MTNPIIRSIYIRSLNHVIANQGSIPWKIDGDEMRFLNLTSGHVAIMGYNTWMSLPKRPLPLRFNIVVTDTHYDECMAASVCDIPPVRFARSLDEALQIAKDWCSTPQALNAGIWIIGGASLYKAAEPIIDEVYETVVLCNQVKGDTHYRHDTKRMLVSEDRTIAEINGIPYDAIHRVFKIVR